MSNDITGGLRNLKGGSIDALRGPYPTITAANLAIPNTIVDGVNFREGKFVEIGTLATGFVTYWWKGGYADVNLVEYFGELAGKETERVVNNILSPIDIDVSTPYKTPNGYYRLTDGVYVNSENWKSTQMVSVNPNDYIKRVGNPFVVGGSVATPVAFFSKSNVYLGGMASITEVSTFQIKDVFPTAAYIYVSNNNTTPVFQVFRTITIPEKNVDGLAAIKLNQNSAYNPRANNKAGILKNGFYNKTTGLYEANSGYVSTEKINVNPDDLLIRKGNAYDNSASATSPILFWNISDVFLGSFSGLISADYSLTIKDLFPTARKIALTSTSVVGLEVYINSIIDQLAVKGLPKIATDVKSNLNNISRLVDGSFEWANTDNLKVGYRDATGAIITAGAGNWRYTDDIPVVAGDVLRYKGRAQNQARAVIAQKIDGSFTVLLGAVDTVVNYTDVIVPVGVKVVVASVLITAPAASFIAPKVKIESNSSDALQYFMPKNLYGRIGEELRVNPFGIIAKNPLDRSLDIVWANQRGNENFISFTPTADNQKIILKVRKKGVLTSLGEINVCATGSPTSPAAPMVGLVGGDSTARGQEASGIEGAVPNETCRRLTGFGTSITPLVAPAALALGNIRFIGTKGDQPVKHEGVGGWSFNNYLNTPVGNSFWNPATSKFDLNYYLTQNNFLESQVAGGVKSDGSNLVIYWQCIWNSVYAQNVTLFKSTLATFLSLITAQYPLAKVKLVGVWPAPADNYREFADGRNVSAESVMLDAVITYSNAVTEVIGSNINYEFIPIAPVFFPEESFSSVMKPIHKRSLTMRKFYTDYVHPNAVGYGQIADALFYNFLYNFCR